MAILACRYAGQYSAVCLSRRRVAGIILGGMTSGRIEDFRIAVELGVPMVCGAESELTEGAGF
ncbi:MAG: hypothetical protein CFH40_02506, partial [Alphaproteobacteria bacterium MarineAlpha10_Bin3]